MIGGKQDLERARASFDGRGSFRGNGRRRIFDLETVQLEVKRRPYATGATPRELGVHRLRGISNLLCVLPTGPWAVQVQPAIPGIYVSMIYDSAGSNPPLKKRGIPPTCWILLPISRRHPAFSRSCEIRSDGARGFCILIRVSRSCRCRSFT